MVAWSAALKAVEMAMKLVDLWAAERAVLLADCLAGHLVAGMAGRWAVYSVPKKVAVTDCRSADWWAEQKEPASVGASA